MKYGFTSCRYCNQAALALWEMIKAVSGGTAGAPESLSALSACFKETKQESVATMWYSSKRAIDGYRSLYGRV